MFENKLFDFGASDEVVVNVKGFVTDVVIGAVEGVIGVVVGGLALLLNKSP